MGLIIIPLVSLLLLFVAGWISNIVQVVHMASMEPLLPIFWVKLVCILIAPVGSILGIVGWF